MATISQIHARQILDSRGNPTVEVDVHLDDGSMGRASVPSGASTGTHEVLELRDGDTSQYMGKGVENAVEHINGELATALANNDPFAQFDLDNEMVIRDGTVNDGRLGANAILGVSLAVSRAAAASLKLPYYKYISQLYGQICEDFPELTQKPISMPRPMFNVLNGGAHTNWQTTDIQEFMLIPLQKTSFSEHLRQCTEIYHHLAFVLTQRNLITTVGDEGGFAPALKCDEEAIEVLLLAIEAAGYKAGTDIGIGLDPAVSALWENGKYNFRVEKKIKTTEQVIDMWADWVRQYPIVSLEDGLAEDDWEGWVELSKKLGDKVQIVGDDLLVTNTDRIQKAIELKACNALLMKVNQIGTLTESLQAICAAQSANWGVIVSHRSGETEDTSIADIVVGTGAGQIKAGALSRSERLAKYNQLLRIEEELTTPVQASVL
ncbi:phosphopyruvate hydratase [soil metagenome]